MLGVRSAPPLAWKRRIGPRAPWPRAPSVAALLRHPPPRRDPRAATRRGTTSSTRRWAPRPWPRATLRRCGSRRSSPGARGRSRRRRRAHASRRVAPPRAAALQFLWCLEPALSARSRAALTGWGPRAGPPQVRHLIRQLISPLPSARPTAAQVLAHPWVAGSYPGQRLPALATLGAAAEPPVPAGGRKRGWLCARAPAEETDAAALLPALQPAPHAANVAAAAPAPVQAATRRSGAAATVTPPAAAAAISTAVSVGGKPEEHGHQPPHAARSAGGGSPQAPWSFGRKVRSGSPAFVNRACEEAVFSFWEKIPTARVCCDASCPHLRARREGARPRRAPRGTASRPRPWRRAAATGRPPPRARAAGCRRSR